MNVRNAILDYAMRRSEFTHGELCREIPVADPNALTRALKDLAASGSLTYEDMIIEKRTVRVYRRGRPR